MPQTIYRGRRAARIENDHLRLIALVEGAHIAEIFDKRTGVNPVWTPPWPSIEPSRYDRAKHPEYGCGSDAKLLAGLMGHNICLDIFGGLSDEEAAAGLDVHGEAPVATYKVHESEKVLTLAAHLPAAQLDFTRQIALHDRSVRIREQVENLSACDRPIGWTQHVTLGPPFLERGITEFRISATRSKVFESVFGVADYLETAAEFNWPLAPVRGDRRVDLTRLNSAAVSSAFTTHLMNPAHEHAFFIAYSPRVKLAFGYIRERANFPWLGMWEENHSRTAPPWNGEALAIGMEFGVSPMPETRRAMIDRGKLFGIPTYRWIPAKSCAEVEYWIIAQVAGIAPETFEWPA